MPMEIVYEGKKRFKAATRGLELTIDQPLEGGGSNQGFTPPELLIAALGSCVGVYLEHFCLRHEIDISKMKITLDWEKASQPARIGKINCVVDIPDQLDSQMVASLLKVAHQCLIHNTLLHEPEVGIEVKTK